jgi:acyl-CoA thioesterase
MNAQHIAEAVRDLMWREDRASKALDMQVQAISPGAAVLTMTVRADMLNGLQTCHGGLMATLADSAFAFACNSYNEVTVASGFDVNLLSAAKLHDVLTASAIEVSRAGRTGVYDVQVHNQRRELVAVFRGRSYSIKGNALVADLPICKHSGKPA